MPKQVDAPAQRRLITAAAISVINDAGLEGARLRDVARAADVTTGAVMHYFDDKDAVLEAALEEVVRRTLQRMQQAPADPHTTSDVATFIERVCRYLPIDATGREEWRVWLAFWGRAIANPRLRQIHQRYYREIIDHLLGPLRTLAGNGEPVADSDLRDCADALVAAIDGVGTRATLEPDLWPAPRQQHTLRTLLLPLLIAFVTGQQGALLDA